MTNIYNTLLYFENSILTRNPDEYISYSSSSKNEIGMFGIFGCNIFLLSVNFGTPDKIADDGKDSGKARAISIIAPVIMAVLVLLNKTEEKKKEWNEITRFDEKSNRVMILIRNNGKSVRVAERRPTRIRSSAGCGSCVYGR